MQRITAAAMLASAGSLLACQLTFGIRLPQPQGLEYACPSEGAAAQAPRTISGMIARFEEWKGGVCIPRLEKPFQRG